MLASKLLQKCPMEARMESLDDEAGEMKMSLVKRNRAAGLCRFCPPVLPLIPHPPPRPIMPLL